MIRLAVRCTPEQAEIVLAELTVLAPNGVEEERGPGYVEYAIYGGEGELPELGEIEVAAGDGLVEVVATEVPDDWADRWQDFHKPLLVGERLGCARPGRSRARGRSTWSSIRGRLSARVLIRPRGCALSFCSSWRRQGRPEARYRSWHRLRRARDRGVEVGWEPVSGYDHEGPSIEAATTNAEANDVSLVLEQRNLREGLPELAPTVVANMTAPVLKVVAEQLSDGGSRRGLPEQQRGGSGRPSPGSRNAHPLRSPS